MINVPDKYYRISVKALVLNKEKKFLLTKEDNGKWELPGGGIEFGEDYKTCLKRELKEETGLTVTHINDRPAYFFTDKHPNYKWISNVLFETKLKDLNFTPSEECIEMRFFSKEEAAKEKIFSNVKTFIKLFDPKNH